MNKVRSWLIRKLLQSDRVEQVVGASTSDMYAEMLRFVGESMARDYQKYSAEFMAQKFTNVSPDFLALAVKANNNLSDAQKIQIMNLLIASGASNSYIG
jgi:hypothetical protein